MRSGTSPARPRTQRTSAPSPTSPRTCRLATTTATSSARWTWWVESRAGHGWGAGRAAVHLVGSRPPCRRSLGAAEARAEEECGVQGSGAGVPTSASVCQPAMALVSPRLSACHPLPQAVSPVPLPPLWGHGALLAGPFFPPFPAYSGLRCWAAGSCPLPETRPHAVSSPHTLVQASVALRESSPFLNR